MRVMFTFFYLTIGFNGLYTRPCDPQSYSMDEVEGIVYALATDKGVLPTVILNRLLRKVRVKQRTEKVRPKNQLQEIAFQELINSESLPRSPSLSGSKMRVDRRPTVSEPFLPPPPGPERGTFFVPPIEPPMPPVSQQGGNSVVPGMLLPQGFPPQLPHMVPHSMFIPFPKLSPPPGVTVRIRAGSPDDTIPDVTVTLSPMMTIVEALKQADRKFRSLLGDSSRNDEEIISFSYSPFAECYVIRSFDNVETNENGLWKIIVSDISGKVIYDSVCLPSRKEVPVKPGMTITLLYTLV